MSDATEASKAWKYVAYYRVSTDKQGRSGLGLEAQQATAERYVASVGGRLVDSYTEVESGKRADRPQLAAALRACRIHRATLVIAKLDRLSRDVYFISKLMKSGADFFACDVPVANKMVIHVLAALAENERDLISQRTKAALGALKARGKRLGFANVAVRGAEAAIIAGNKGRAAAIQRSAEVRREQFAVRVADLRDLIEHLRNEKGLTTQQALADELNNLDIPTPRGKRWHQGSVRRLLIAIAANKDKSTNTERAVA